MLLFINLLILVWSAYGAIDYEWTDCLLNAKPADFQNACAARGSATKTCRHYNNEEKICWVSCNIVGCKSYDRAHCECSSDCNYNDIKKISTCNINKLEKVDEEIGKQIAFNVGGSIAGNIPYVGGLFDAAFAAWGPVSPVTSEFSLANAIREEVNAANKQLVKCMDDKISLNEVDNAWTEFEGSLQRYETAQGASGSVRVTKVNGVFTHFEGDLAEMFSNTEKRSYIEYEGMLPLFKALYPIWGTVAAERLIYLKTHPNDDVSGNYDNELSATNKVFDVMITWINKAKSSIRDHLSKVITDKKCRNDANMRSELASEMTHFDDLYIKPINTLKSAINTDKEIVTSKGEYINIGKINDFVTLGMYSPLYYDHGMSYNPLWNSIQSITMNGWNTGIIISTTTDYPMGNDANTLRFGKSILSKYLDNSPTSNDWYSNHILVANNEYLLGFGGIHNDISLFAKKLRNPWINIGHIKDMDSLVAKYPFTNYEFGINSNTALGSIHKIIANTWERGIRISTTNYYPMGDDLNTLRFGRIVLTRGLDNSPTPNDWYSNYILAANNEYLSGLGGISNEISLFAKKLSNPWIEVGGMTDIETLVSSYPFTKYEYGVQFYSMLSIHKITVNSRENGKGVNVSTINEYPMGNDRNTLRFGRTVFSKVLSMSTGANVWYNNYIVVANNDRISGSGPTENYVRLFVKELSNPWVEIGTINDMETLVSSYPFSKWEYGVQFNSALGSIHRIWANSWGVGDSMESIESYPMGSDRYTLKFGRVIFTKGKYNDPNINDWYHHYYYLENNEKVSGSNDNDNANSVKIFVRSLVYE